MTTFTARTDRTLVRAGARSTRYVLLQATAPKQRTRKAPKRAAVNVAFVLDRSGSMAGSKLALAKYAVERALTGLAPKDRFAIVTYDDRVETVVASCLASPANKTKALLRLQDVDARGSTDLHGGWSAGADAIKAHLSADGVNRCLPAQLVAEETAFSAAMPELDRKRAYYRSSNAQRSRDDDGQARR